MAYLDDSGKCVEPEMQKRYNMQLGQMKEYLANAQKEIYDGVRIGEELKLDSEFLHRLSECLAMTERCLDESGKYFIF